MCALGAIDPGNLDVDTKDLCLPSAAPPGNPS
jgi:hypothetical protein